MSATPTATDTRVDAPVAPPSRGARWDWRRSSLEALRNVVAAPVLFGILTASVAGVTAGAAVLDEATVAGIVHDEHTFLVAGGDILHASTDSGVIDAGACESAGRLPGVEVAAALDQRQARVAGRSEYTQTVLVGTAGIERVFGAAPLGAGESLVAKQVAERWSWSPGTIFGLQPDPTDQSRWTPPSGTLRVAATPSFERLGDTASTAVLVVSPLRTADECVVQASPNEIDAVAAALPALLTETSGKAVTVRRQVSAGRFGPHAAHDFAVRPTRSAGLMAGAVTGLLMAFFIWSRRQRTALYATLGVRRSHGVVIRFTEAATPLLTGAAWGALVAALAGVGLGLAPPTSLGFALRHTAAAICVALSVTLLTSLWRPPVLAALKER